MKHVKTHGLVGLCLLILLSTFQFQSFANSDNLMLPMYVNIFDFESELEIKSNGLAEVSCFLSAEDVEKVSISVILQKYEDGNWKTLKSWQKNNDACSISLKQSYYVSSGYNYRIVSSGYAYRNGKMIESTKKTSKVIKY